VLLLGIVGGLLGSVFISLNARLVAWRREHLAPHGAKAKVAEALLISVLTSGTRMAHATQSASRVQSWHSRLC
jgi:H+/Cl- antiporter ClcA